MSWIVLGCVCVVLLVATLAVRRGEHIALANARERVRQARAEGTHEARLQVPFVDLSRCLGCATCIRACPEDGVLDLIHGQAAVVHGARCVGHGLCARECPTEAIKVTIAGLEERRDIPALEEDLGVCGAPGLFLAGEVTGFALIRTAIAHGAAVARQAAAHARRATPSADSLDLVIVGAGPAGLACALAARDEGLNFVVLEQDTPGGAVASYPRHKLVMTQPVELPRYGRLSRSSYSKEELIELWQGLIERDEIPVRTGVRLEHVEALEGGGFDLRAGGQDWRARAVVLAVGRRGTPRKLGVPGEHLPKVAYSLIDAASYQNRRILVVGGGDSAVEAAAGLAEQAGNQVLLSYRRGTFSRIKARNRARIEALQSSGRLSIAYESQVLAIEPQCVQLQVGNSGSAATREIANDDVFVFAGGIPPFDLLERCGVSFDPADRPRATPLEQRGSGLWQALCGALIASWLALAWVWWRRDYYAAERVERLIHPDHSWLRPSSGLGLALGIVGTCAIVANLMYLARRSAHIPLERGSLRAWMTGHVATGALALLAALVHASMAPRNTVGGHALWGLVALVATGAVGRYVYSFVPRAANGKELESDEAQAHSARLLREWDEQGRGLEPAVRSTFEELLESSAPEHVRGRLSFAWFLPGHERGRNRRLNELRRSVVATGRTAREADQLVGLARRAEQARRSAARLEELRGVLATWRYVHRWGALLMLLLVIVHVVIAVRFASLGTS